MIAEIKNLERELESLKLKIAKDISFNNLKQKKVKTTINYDKQSLIFDMLDKMQEIENKNKNNAN